MSRRLASTSTSESPARVDEAHAPVHRVPVVRVGSREPVEDHVAVERPLEVRINGASFSVIMRTPGSDRELALGFLFSEGLVRGPDDVEHVDLHEPADTVNVVFARSRTHVAAAALSQRRRVAVSSSCGMCGRRTLASVRVDVSRAAIDWSVDADTIRRLPDVLRAAQPAFAQTGGLHAAACFDVHGALEASAEDVGRHNAVDKLLGRMLEAGRLPLARSLLLVSGRTSFEIVQKAWLGGIPLVAAVSAPSSLAIEIARDAGITLLGFLRQGRFNIYTHAERVAPVGAGALDATLVRGSPQVD
jgi:FdhD protein